jgi:hypothetical protein
VHRDPYLHVRLLGDPIADRERRSHRALGIILVRDGAPKTDITASPMNFSTVPPYRSSSERRRA